MATIFGFLFFCIILLFTFVNRITYFFSDYAKMTNTPYSKVMKDKGLKGEYEIFLALKKLPGYKKVLFNSYLPGPDKTITEVDIILIHTSGVYVIESKNYSGWIFGKESDYKWTQTFKNKKVQFYNPIKQNNGHIKFLQNNLSSFQHIPYYSLIVFGNNCSLKKIEIQSSDIKVIQKAQLNEKILNSGKVLSNDMIDKIFNKLKPYTNVSKEIKDYHLEKVKEYKGDKKNTSRHRGA